MKTLKTNTKEFNEMYFKYILESINFEDFDPKNDKEKMELFWVDFDQRANFENNKKRIPNLQDRIADFLRGIPYNFKFANHEILEMAVNQRSLPENYTEKQADRILENYWNFTALKIMQLSKKLGIDVSLFY
jgi:hypothetical protein